MDYSSPPLFFQVSNHGGAHDLSKKPPAVTPPGVTPPSPCLLISRRVSSLLLGRRRPSHPCPALRSVVPVPLPKCKSLESAYRFVEKTSRDQRPHAPAQRGPWRRRRRRSLVFRRNGRQRKASGVCHSRDYIFRCSCQSGRLRGGQTSAAAERLHSPSDSDGPRNIHAIGGSGSIFETLRLRKPLIVVVNEDLMDNHQSELADELAERNHLFCAHPQTLRETIEAMDLNVLQPYTPGDAKPVVALINKFLGFPVG